MSELLRLWRGMHLQPTVSTATCPFHNANGADRVTAASPASYLDHVPSESWSKSPSDHQHESSSTSISVNPRTYGEGPDYTGALATVREGRTNDGVAIAWRSFVLASEETIESLLSVYIDIVYPIYPIFHAPTLWERVRKRDHLTDQGFLASVMAACALASARTRDGALNEYTSFPKDGPVQQSEIFFSAAADAIPKDLNKATGSGYLRACGLLALTAMQYGQIASMHQYLGHFCTISAVQHLHDELYWPLELTFIEKEERRRLYWSMYCLDVLSTVVFNSIPKFDEVTANVRYPAEVDDENITPIGLAPSSKVNWLRGWNFTTDLFRVLEHTIRRVRRIHAPPREDRPSVSLLLVSDALTDAQIMENILHLYYQLPARFKDYTVIMSGNRSDDRFGFQTANIQATLQLVRMTLFSVNIPSDVYQKCNVADQVLRTFHGICPRFLSAISTPLVYHLGGIGQLLASVMEGHLTEASYTRVRQVLESMVSLVEILESDLQPGAGASKALRTQIDKIDMYMRMSHPLPLSAPSHQQNPNAFTIPPMQHRRDTGAMNRMSGHVGSGGMEEFTLPQEIVGEFPWPLIGHRPGYMHNATFHGFDGG
ncbi:hypothetical protein B0A48_18339 [Cryoendolithus antarcticus]|uniref:Xylanolytic transcriptional activator regulatory domain-containing protein n=1 Tax=Cryoendolithus antarcticus TaxID=1507870 RepID=A0A1V8SAJ7_9PEZI|nr:hypothetical protein B0A48_18339 [Cryoendolithus antarcticus]